MKVSQVHGRPTAQPTNPSTHHHPPPPRPLVSYSLTHYRPERNPERDAQIRPQTGRAIHPSTPKLQAQRSTVNATHSTPDSSVDKRPRKGTTVIFALLAQPSPFFEIPIIPSIHPIKTPLHPCDGPQNQKRDTAPAKWQAGPIREPERNLIWYTRSNIPTRRTKKERAQEKEVLICLLRPKEYVRICCC